MYASFLYGVGGLLNSVAAGALGTAAEVRDNPRPSRASADVIDVRGGKPPAWPPRICAAGRPV